MVHGIEGLPEALAITPRHWPEDMHGRKPGDWEFETPELPSSSTLEELYPDLDLPDDHYRALKRYAFDPVLTAPLLVPSTGTVYFERQSSPTCTFCSKSSGSGGRHASTSRSQRAPTSPFLNDI